MSACEKLIPINDQKQTVNARDLHEFLEVGTQFSKWIQRRIDDYGFVQDIDFVVVKNATQYNQVDTIEYHVSIDMAKELSMVERTERGKQARQYFIECERCAKQAQVALPTDPIELFRMSLAAIEHTAKRVESQEHRLTLVKEENKAAADASRLSADQISQAEFVLKEKLSNLPYRVRLKTQSKIYGMIKRNCLETPYITNMTWKDVSQKNFAKVLDVINTYELPRWV